jgi:hypothetical protein
VGRSRPANRWLYSSRIINSAALTVTEYPIASTVCIPACMSRLPRLVSAEPTCLPDSQAFSTAMGTRCESSSALSSAASTGSACSSRSPSRKRKARLPSYGARSCLPSRAWKT